MTAKRSLLILFALTSAIALVAAGPAQAQEPFWGLSGETLPTNLPPGAEGQIIVLASDLGPAPIGGASEQVVFVDKLPAGLKATAINGPTIRGVHTECVLASLRCTFAGTLNPYQQLAIEITVKVEEPDDATASLVDEASVEGGGAPRVARTLKLPISREPASFGIDSYEAMTLSENGTPATEAGSHPFQLTTTFSLNENSERYPVALPKDIHLNLPPGLIGNPTAIEQCTMTDFFALVETTNLCPPSSVVGVATVIVHEPIDKVFTKTVPVFNLVPSQDEPARLGFEVAGKVPVVIDTAVRSDSDYGVVATVEDATQTAGLLSSQVTIWGVPGAPSHDGARGWECVAGGEFANQIGKPCPASTSLPQTPFLTMPTSCPTGPMSFSAETDSWQTPGAFDSALFEWFSGQDTPINDEGCGQLQFAPQIGVAPEETQTGPVHATSTPTGVTVDVRVPSQGLLEAEGRAQADLRDATVTLPEGVQLSPSAANGLEGCSEEQIEGNVSGVEHERFKAERSEQLTGAPSALASDPLVFPDTPVQCPEASKVGRVKIKTPLLSSELEGSVYLASPAPNGESGRNPFDSLIAVYLVAEDKEAGILVKLAGRGEVNEATGQISTTFTNSPQVPFEELKLELFGGPRASLATPAHCGDYATSAAFTPWSGAGALDVSSLGEEFGIVSGPEGSGCPAGALPFSPAFVTKATNTEAGGFTSFDLELARPDGDQALSAVSMHLPEGVAALLSSVELCSEAQAAATACPAGSQIGEATAVAGLGSEPYVQHGGKVYITGPYHGAPFGLDIVTPADAGPFDLGYISVRSRLQVNPANASVTIESDPLPTEIRGIPLQLKRVLVTVNKPGFEFNPTNCGTPFKVEGTVSGSEGASWGGSSPYPLRGCSSLPFTPTLTAGAVGHGSKADGTTFKVVVASGGVNSGGVVQAGIAKVDLQLPKQLSSRLPTLQKACTEQAFNTNPASCDEGSIIGTATIHTPVLKNPVSGPAYLVSHGNAGFPDVEFVLQGEGITLVLDGKTQIKNQITYSKFESAPDAPFTVFETVLPAGPHGVLTPNVAESKHFSLCGETLEMPTTMTGQNGARIEQTTKVTVSGCGEVRSAKAKKLTLMQKLQRSLKICRRRNKHSKTRRQRCERQAHARYTNLALAACRHQHKHAKGKRQQCEKQARRKYATTKTATARRKPASAEKHG